MGLAIMASQHTPLNLPDTWKGTQADIIVEEPLALNTVENALTRKLKKPLLDYLKEMGILMNMRTIRRKRRLDQILGRYALIHYISVREKKVDKHCSEISNHLNNHPAEASFWSMSYAKWNKQKA